MSICTPDTQEVLMNCCSCEVGWLGGVKGAVINTPHTVVHWRLQKSRLQVVMRNFSCGLPLRSPSQLQFFFAHGPCFHKIRKKETMKNRTEMGSYPDEMGTEMGKG